MKSSWQKSKYDARKKIGESLRKEVLLKKKILNGRNKFKK